MDIKLKSNDNEPYEEALVEEAFEEETFGDKPSARRRGEKGKKLTGAVLFSGAVVLIALCYIFFSNMINYQKMSPYDLLWDNYYGAQTDLTRFAKNVNRYILYYGGESFETEQNVTIGDKEEYQERQLSRFMEEQAALEEEYRQRVIDSYNQTGISESYSINYDTLEDGINVTIAESFEPGLNVYDELYNEREQALEDLRNKYDVSYLDMREEILAEKKQNYADIKKYLSEMEDTFQYFLYNAVEFTIYSNIPGISADIRNTGDLRNAYRWYTDENSDSIYLYIDINDGILHNNIFNGVSLASSFAESGYEGFIIMPRDSALAVDLQGITRKTDMHHAYNIIALVASFVLLVSLLIFCFTSRLRDFAAGNALFYGLYLKQPFLMKIFASGALCLLFISDLFNAPNLFREFSYSFIGGIFFAAFVTGVFSLGALYLIISLEYTIITLRNLKNLKEEPEFRLLRSFKQNTTAVRQTKNLPLILFYIASMCSMVAGTLLAGIGVLWTIDRWEYLITIVILSGYCVAMFLLVTAFRLSVGYARLASTIYSITGGSLETVPVSKGAFIRGDFSKPLMQLDGLEEGLRKSIAEAVKSQRLKAELITNVSHDLKTPLTSIINYVDLLKKCACFSNDQAALDYIAVLEKKSRRLQVLIEDLFEASKLNSGSAELNLEIVDLVDLLKQAMGEMSEKLEASAIVFRVRYEKEHVYAYVDGKKIWRVFENLLNNILKYSQPHSRAYLSMEEKDDIIEVVFKNISAYEIDFDAEELFERFKRGDDSRSTEGSGLGLSIARSIVELHSGTMEIVVDGDLFKVAVRIAKAG